VPTNFYFNNFPANQITSEQLLVEDLVIESMQINGMDVFYLPRQSGDGVDYLYGEDTSKKYTQAYPLEMYLEDVTGMDGEQDFISKFGLEIRDELKFLVSRRRFKATVGQFRPNEGDLIYVPLVQNFFEITFVEHENDQAMFYTLGRGRGGNVYVFALKLKQYVFSNEIIETGINEIDIQIRNYYPRTRLVFDTVVGNFLNDEIIYQGNSLANATAQAVVYDCTPGINVIAYRTQGVFTTGTLKGVTSNAEAQILVTSDTAELNNAFEDIIDNARVQEEGLSVIDWTEKNPFGET
jgi:hypothetical protein